MGGTVDRRLVRLSMPLCRLVWTRTQFHVEVRCTWAKMKVRYEIALKDDKMDMNSLIVEQWCRPFFPPHLGSEFLMRLITKDACSNVTEVVYELFCTVQPLNLLRFWVHMHVNNMNTPSLLLTTTKRTGRVVSCAWLRATMEFWWPDTERVLPGYCLDGFSRFASHVVEIFNCLKLCA